MILTIHYEIHNFEGKETLKTKFILN